MSLRALRIFVVASAGLCAGLLAPVCARALTDTLMVTDLQGNVLLDIHGNRALATLTEGGPPSQSRISFDVEVPDVVPITTAGVVLGIEMDPDPSTHRALVSDSILATVFHSSPTV